MVKYEVDIFSIIVQEIDKQNFNSALELLTQLLEKNSGNKTLITKIDEYRLLHIAIMMKKIDLANALLDLGANPILRCATMGTPFYQALMSPSNFGIFPKILKKILEYGDNEIIKDIKTYLSSTTLNIALESEDFEFLETLLQFDLNPNIADEVNRRPLALANNLNEIKLLLEHGANPSLEDGNIESFSPVSSYLYYKGIIDTYTKLLENNKVVSEHEMYIIFKNAKENFKNFTNLPHHSYKSVLSNLLNNAILDMEKIEFFLNNGKWESNGSSLVTACFNLFKRAQEQPEILQLIPKIVAKCAYFSLANIKERETNNTLLHLALEYKCMEVIAIFLDASKAIFHYLDLWETVNTFKQNILHIACKNGLEDAIEKIINICFKSNRAIYYDRDNDGNTPLHVLIENNESSLLNVFFEKIPNLKVDVKNNENLTPLDLAIKLGDSKAIRIFIKHKKADINQIIIYAFKNKCDMCLDTLLGSKKLLFEVKNNNLIEFVNINLKLIYQEYIHTANYEYLKAHIVKLMSMFDDYANTTNSNKKTPLSLAVENNDEYIVKEILNFPDFSVTDNTLTAINMAVQNPPILKIFLEKITTEQLQNFKLDNMQNSILHKVFDFDIVHFLIKTKNFNPNIINSAGETPLHLAVKYDNKEMIIFLLEVFEKNNLLMLEDKNGHTPLDYAQHNNDILTVLENFMFDTKEKCTNKLENLIEEICFLWNTKKLELTSQRSSKYHWQNFNLGYFENLEQKLAENKNAHENQLALNKVVFSIAEITVPDTNLDILSQANILLGSLTELTNHNDAAKNIFNPCLEKLRIFSINLQISLQQELRHQSPRAKAS